MNRSRSLWRRLGRDTRGIELVEMTLVLPILLIVVFGLLEFGTVFDRAHSVSGLTREGANLAARGASLDSVLQITLSNGSQLGIGTQGAVIASRVDVISSVPQVTDQRVGGNMVVSSKVGPVGGQAAPFVGGGLASGRTYYVVEVFLPHQPFTPLRGFVSPILPDTLYDRSLF